MSNSLNSARSALSRCSSRRSARRIFLPLPRAAAWYPNAPPESAARSPQRRRRKPAHNSGGAMISGRNSRLRSATAPSAMIRVSVIPPGTSTLAVTPVPARSADRRRRFGRGLAGTIEDVALAQHRAEAGGDRDDAAALGTKHVRHDRPGHHQGSRRVYRDKAAPLLRRDFPKPNRVAAAVGADRILADPRVVDQDVDPARLAD